MTVDETLPAGDLRAIRGLDGYYIHAGDIAMVVRAMMSHADSAPEMRAMRKVCDLLERVAAMNPG